MGTHPVVAPVTDVHALRALSLEEIRRTQLGVLDAIGAHCTAHGIRYYLCAGTLLGAVRHGGYIPWDDDIDVMFPRPDFERFCATFDPPASDSTYVVHSAATSAGFGLPFAKVCDTRTVLDVESDVVKGIGVFVDAFPLDGWCDGALAGRAQRGVLALLTQLMRVKHLSLRSARGGARTVALRAAKVVLAALPARTIATGLTRVARRGRFGATADAGVIVWGYRETVPQECYGEPVDVDFEGRRLPGPADADRVLRVLYGDYLTLPPVAQQVTLHRFRAFAR